VIYMLDGQLLFDGSIYPQVGEIGIDEILDALHADGDPGVIAIAIEFDPVHRGDEYLPWVNNQAGGGQAEEYLAFITDTLKSWVDANYRTIPDRISTGLFGISNGGVFATYAAVSRSDVFGRVLAFSSTYCLNPEIFDYISDSTPPGGFLRLGFLSGQEEASDLCPAGSFPDGQQEVMTRLETAGYAMSGVRAEVKSPSAHAFWFWEDHFSEMYQWLMADVATSVDTSVPLPATTFDLYPNPGGSSMSLFVSGSREVPVTVFDALGRIVVRSTASPGRNTIDSSRLPSGPYFVRLEDELKPWIKR